jgi:hypothetical protein
MQFEIIEVQCYSGYKSNDRPVRFSFNGREFRVMQIIDRWYEGSLDSSMPVLDYFKILTDDGEQYIIRHNHLFDKWSVALHKR